MLAIHNRSRNAWVALFCCVAGWLASCKKEFDSTPASVSTTPQSSDALVQSRHSSYFETDYPFDITKPAPYFHNKHVYSNARIYFAQWHTRAYPNHPSYPNHEYRFSFDFIYPSFGAYVVAQGARHTVVHHSTGYYTSEINEMIYEFKFNSAGFCTTVRMAPLGGSYSQVLKLYYKPGNPRVLDSIYTYDKYRLGTQAMRYVVKNDLNNNIVSITPKDLSKPYHCAVKYTYKTAKTGERYFYMPSQYAISQEYSMLETLQWVPVAQRERTAVSITFLPRTGGTRIVQGQKYINHKFDATGSLVSYSYADGYLHRNTWTN